MLPNILDVAEKNGIEINKKTYGKKETLAKCPFCLEDSNKQGKYYLSLNTESQVYKCWFCKASGGVLDFEAKITNTPYEEVREKYFGKKRKHVHPADTLSLRQLDRIGWKDIRKDRETFKRNRDIVLKEWQRYEYRVLSELYAELLIIMKLPIERRNNLLSYFKKRCEDSPIRDCFFKVTETYKLQNHASEWAKDGLKIARISWRMSLSKSDFSKVLVQVPFVHYLYTLEKNKLNQQAG